MPNKSLQATRDGRFRRRCAMARQASSAVAEDVINPAWLSSWSLARVAPSLPYESESSDDTTESASPRDYHMAVAC
jgi:hypothetical protein